MFQLITAIVAGAAALLAGIAAYNLYEKYVNYSLARTLALQKAQDERLTWDRIIVEEISRGNVSYVKLGIFNNGTKNAVLRINAEDISNDLSTGMILLS